MLWLVRSAFAGPRVRLSCHVEALIEACTSLRCLRVRIASNLGDLYTESGQILQGSFSAVSKPNFAHKYSLELAICWKALAEIYTMHSFAPFWNPYAKTGEKGAWPKQPRKGRKQENERPISSAQQAT